MTIEHIVASTATFDRAFWTSAANAAVRAECGWHVAPIITETLELDGSGSRNLLLPSGRVKTLIRITNDGRDVLADVRPSKRNGYLYLASRWSPYPGTVEIELEHGHGIDEVPDVAGVIAALISRGMSTPAGIAVAETIGPASVRRATGKEGGLLSIPLLESEKATLAPYKLNWGA